MSCKSEVSHEYQTVASSFSQLLRRQPSGCKPGDCPTRPQDQLLNYLGGSTTTCTHIMAPCVPMPPAIARAMFVAEDGFRNTYVGGFTNETDFPTTQGRTTGPAPSFARPTAVIVCLGITSSASSIPQG